MLSRRTLARSYLLFCVVVLCGFYYYTSRGQRVLNFFSGRVGAHKGASQFHK